MSDIVKYQNKIIKGAELLPPPHPMDGSCNSSILIYVDQEPELCQKLLTFSEWEEIVFEINSELVRCQVDQYDQQKNIIVLKTEKEQSDADTPYQQ
ncbi:hypothetical protein [Serratia proteamaculans]|uniref:hypothetical protein n=1 Tax=Serratia proteamaculans TaxID=28151 RepID=UPI00217ABD57|nr:hypothetical protein [Serratia proteamaculans]CAI0988970.1 Uncharacterised protein [Serratia proteamaculans]